LLNLYNRSINLLYKIFFCFVFVTGDFYSLFVYPADRGHCQDGAVRPSPLPSAAADDVRDLVLHHLHNFRYFSQHITPTRTAAGGLRKVGKYKRKLKEQTPS